MATVPDQPKKPAGGAFGRFMAAKRSEFAKQCAGKPVSEVTKLGGAEWKKVSDEDKAVYQKAFEEAQKKYAADMEAFLGAGGVKQKGASALRTEKKKAKAGKLAKKAAKDPDAPKRPVGGAYGCYLNGNRALFQKECPGSVTGVAKHATEKWKALSEAEKEPYAKEYEAKAAAYQEAMKSYTPPAKDVGEEPDSDAEPPAKKGKMEKKAAGTERKAAAAAKQTVKADGKSAKAKAKGKAKVEERLPEIPKTVLAKAQEAKMEEVLTKLLKRDDVKSAGVSAGKALEALQQAGGLLHAARRGLLGA